MSSLEKRVKKMESILKQKYNHHGAFFILINNGIYRIENQEDKPKIFKSMKELETYVYNKYECQKYVFITFDITNIKKAIRKQSN